MKRAVVRLGVAGTLAVLSLSAVGIPAQAADTQPARPGVSTEAAVLRSVAAPAAVTMFGQASINHQLWADDGTPPGWASASYPKDPWSSPGTTKSYQWLRDGVAIPGATSAWYSIDAADVGKKLSYRVTGSAPGYKSVTRTSESSPAVYSMTPAPSLSYDRVIVGTYLNASLDTPWVTPVPVTMTYQWLRNGTPIAGATGTSYRLAAQDLGKSIVLRTQGTNSGKVIETVYTAPVKPSIYSNIVEMGWSEPTFGTNPRVGNTISVRLPIWWKGSEPVTTTFQWLRNGAKIPGATRSSYTPVAADAGKQLTLALIGSRSGSASRTFEAGTWMPKVMPGPPTAAAATITGSPSVGSVLTAKKGTWRAPTPPDVRFQWLRNGVDITGATAATYKLKASDKGTKISVRSTVIVPDSPRLGGSIVSNPVTVQ